MPEYLSPGVYIEEFEIGAKPIEGVATSTAAFLGETERGRTRPTLVTSWLDYWRRFGGVLPGTKYLPVAVRGFFDNGGKRCFVTRIVKLPVAGGETGAALAGGTFDTVRLKAVGKGGWGNRVHVRILKGSTAGFRIKLFYWSVPIEDAFDPDLLDGPTTKPLPSYREDFDNLVMTPRSIDYFEKRLNDGNSALIEAELVPGAGTADPEPTEGAPVALEDGGDGDNPALALGDFEGNKTAGERTGLNALTETDYDDVAILYAPNQEAVDGLRGKLITHCENNKYRFAVLDSKASSANATGIDPRSDRATEYAAFYYPWIKVIDADTGVRRLVPPGGHVAGIYARTDVERGVWKAPANEVVRGAIELEYQIPTGVQDVLNPRGVNVIRTFPGRGRRVWGARTLSADPLWKYVNVRRLFIFLESSIDRGTQWVVFEPNNPTLWARVKQTATQFLRTQWRAGALFGRTEEDAFFVNVDETTMSPDDIANGKLIVVIGVAPVRPAEFVIFRIAQLTGSATEAQQ